MKVTGRQLPDWAIWFACVLPLLGFWAYGLFDLDEGFYGAVVRDMINRHDWITPTLNGVPWFEKPILAYWLAIPSVQMFGDAVGPRLPSVLCTIATYTVLFNFARKHFPLPVARLAVLVYATNLLVVGIGRMMMTDAPLVLCLTVAMTTLATWGLSEERRAGVWQWCVIGLSVGLGVLAKGPVALILFGGVFIFSSLFVPSFKGVWKSAWPLGLVVCLAVLATWYVPCYRANGQEFVQKFLIEQNIGRFAGGDKAHSVPVWAHPVYFPIILIVAFFPWICFSGWTLVRRSGPSTVDSSGKFLWIWALVPLLFFTISGTKLPHYILPAVAPLAMLVAMTLAKVKESWPWEHVGLGWSAFVLVVAQGVSQIGYNSRMKEVRDAADFLNFQLLPVYIYKMGGSGDTSISLTLRETSHPSFLFYFKGSAIESDKPGEWYANAGSYMVFTTKEVAASDPALRDHKGVDPGPQGTEFRVEQSRIDFPGSDRFALIKHTSVQIK